MTPHEPSPEVQESDGSPPAGKPVSRITWLEVLIAVGIIAALVAWLPTEWSK